MARRRPRSVARLLLGRWVPSCHSRQVNGRYRAGFVALGVPSEMADIELGVLFGAGHAVGDEPAGRRVRFTQRLAHAASLGQRRGSWASGNRN